MRPSLALAATIALGTTLHAQQQEADNTFDMSVARPAHASRHPVLAIDEAHNNFHTITGRYAPFAKLMTNDGLRVTASTSILAAKALQGVDVLVISNPAGPGIGAGAPTSPPAFTDAECDAVRDWVRDGGSLLLISDHAPFGSATEILSKRFGVNFGKGFVIDFNHFQQDAGPSALVFEGELLGSHAITAGRDSTERVRRVVSFTGQSMSVPEGATILLRLSKDAMEAPTRQNVAARRGAPVGGRAQGIAMTFGRGRVVMLGEAAMMSAQFGGGARTDAQGGRFKMGMNHDGSDDKQFALNVVRWLTGELK